MESHPDNSEAQKSAPVEGVPQVGIPDQAHQEAYQKMEARTAALETQARAIDPKDSKDVLRSLTEARTLFEQTYKKDLAQATETFNRTVEEIQTDLERVLIREGLLKRPTAREAKESDNAEAIRIRGEMGTLLKRNAYKGVIQKYNELLLLAKKGVDLNADDHLNGGTAHLNLGDIAGAKTAFMESIRLAPERSESLSSLKYINDTYAETKLRGANSLSANESPFDPVQRAAIAYAQAELETEGKFTGYLPVGEYSFNGGALAVNRSVAQPKSEQATLARNRERLSDEERASVDAEITRLSDEILAQMKRPDSGKTISWRAIDSNYQAIMELVKKGGNIQNHEQELHVAASEAARNLGNDRQV